MRVLLYLSFAQFSLLKRYLPMPPPTIDLTSKIPSPWYILFCRSGLHSTRQQIRRVRLCTHPYSEKRIRRSTSPVQLG